MVPDGAGGMLKLEDRRFEHGEWPIKFEIPATQEQAARWSRYRRTSHGFSGGCGRVTAVHRLDSQTRSSG
jgi:hypothetical protein